MIQLILLDDDGITTADSNYNEETAQTDPQPSTSEVQETEDLNATPPTTDSIPNNHQEREGTQSQHYNNATQTH